MQFFNGSGHSFGSAIPFQRVTEVANLGQFLNLEQAELLRIQRYNEHWRFYLGKHWMFEREDGEPLVTVNYAKLVIEKAVGWLVQNGIDITVPEATEKVVKPLLDEVWKYNLRDQFLYDMGITGAVTGDIFILVTYDEPSATSRRRNPRTQGQIRINLLGSEQVFASWDPLDTNVMTSVRIETIYYDDRNQLTKIDSDSKASHTGRQLSVKRFTQVITPEWIIEQYEGGQPEIRKNALGEIPVVHIRNLPCPREFYGLSDFDSGVVDQNREYNEKSTDVSDIIAYQAAPVTVITGAKASQLERGARQIWSGLPPEAKVTTLSLQGELTASVAYLDRTKKQMLEISETPEVLFETPSISNTSAAALAMQYAPIVSKIKRKLPHYVHGLQQVNYLILRVAITTGLLHLPTDLCAVCGGRIVEVLDDKGLEPRLIKRCYRIDKRDFSFLTPAQIKVKHVRQHSFGTETREDPLDKVEKEHKKIAPSRFDPEETESQEEKEAREVRESDAAENTRREADTPPALPGEPSAKPGKIATPPPTPAAPPMDTHDIVMPEEPEKVMLSVLHVDPETGATTRIDRRLVELVPTGCDDSIYLDPFENTVTFRDAIPRDEQIDADLHMLLLTNGIVSKGWVRRHTRSIKADEIDDIEEELKLEGPPPTPTAPPEKAGSGLQAGRPPTGGNQPAAGAGASLARKAGAPATASPGKKVGSKT